VVRADCRAIAQIGGLPVIDSPLEPLLYASPALVWAAAALPGLVMVLARVRPGTRQTGGPDPESPAPIGSGELPR
jgi:hypothetical protein